jgi:hypothetical protein
MPFVLFVHQVGYCRRRADAVNETMHTGLIGRILDRARLARIADALVVAVAISLPWSTSATSILIVLWLVALVPTLDAMSLRRTLATPAGGLPVALWILALFGMLWSVAPVAERLGGLQVFLRLLVIPLLLAQFRGSERGMWVLGGFLVSCTALLLLSWMSKAWPWIWWSVWVPGVPVKDYIVQSGEFCCAPSALRIGPSMPGSGTGIGWLWGWRRWRFSFSPISFSSPRAAPPS